jgi:predicted DNA-binding transcriptional regulator YafY
VDGRTLRRYIAVLEEIGIPITAERGRHGGYGLVAGFRLPPMMFTDDEALALSVGLLAARSLGLAQGASAVASARAKLERVMPANLRRRVRAVDETVTLDLSQAPLPQGNEALAVLAAAAQAGQRVHMHYRSATGSDTERDFDPYGLVHRDGCWYVAGMCHLRNGLRSFRLDRVRSVDALDVAFSRPPGFDAGRHLTFSIASIPRANEVEVLLETDLSTALQVLRESMGLFEPCTGGVLLRSRTDSIDWYARQLAQLPFDFVVRRPQALRDALHRHAGRLLKLSGTRR